MKPKVSIITATYNSSYTLKFAIQSVLNQDFTDFEYLIIGDACNDDSETVVRSFNDPRVKWHNLALNSGSQAMPNNVGLDLARGDFIAYIGHDDLWFPWHLSSLIASLEQQNLSLVHSLTFQIAPKGLHSVIGALGAGRTYVNTFTPPSSWLHRRNTQCWRDPLCLSMSVDNDFLWRWYQQQPSIGASGQPSIIKFPSPWWKSYARNQNFPQDQYAQRLKNPQDLLLELLHQTAVLHAMSDTEFLSWRQSLRQVLKPVTVRLLLSNPEHPILRLWFQRQRRLVRFFRGLK